MLVTVGGQRVYMLTYFPNNKMFCSIPRLSLNETSTVIG